MREKTVVLSVEEEMRRRSKTDGTEVKKSRRGGGGRVRVREEEGWIGDMEVRKRRFVGGCGLEQLKERSVRSEPELIGEHGKALCGEKALVKGTEGFGNLVVDVLDIVEEAEPVLEGVEIG